MIGSWWCRIIFHTEKAVHFNPMIKIYFHTNDTRQNITFIKKNAIFRLLKTLVCLRKKWIDELHWFMGEGRSLCEHKWYVWPVFIEYDCTWATKTGWDQSIESRFVVNFLGNKYYKQKLFEGLVWFWLLFFFSFLFFSFPRSCLLQWDLVKQKFSF